jgi:phosphoglycerate dehydrogenase-like enzyme
VNGKARVRCVVTWPGYEPADPEIRSILEESDLEIVFRPKAGFRSPAEVVEIMSGASAAVVSTDPFDRAVIESLPMLRVIARTGVGLDSIDLEAATRSGVVVTRTTGVHEETVADHALALMLAAVRRVVENDASVRRGEWDRAGPLTPWGLHGSCVGIVGLGRIGGAVARRLRGFACEVVAFDPYAQDLPDIPRVSLDELLARADVVTLHAPLTPETRGLVDARRLERMRPGSVLVNTSRGELVDEAALVEALRSGRLRAAALDVFADEPPAAPGLLELPNVILSPHIAGLTEVSVRELTRQAVVSALDILAGRPNPGIVNPEALAHKRQAPRQ